MFPVAQAVGIEPISEDRLVANHHASDHGTETAYRMARVLPATPPLVYRSTSTVSLRRTSHVRRPCVHCLSVQRLAVQRRGRRQAGSSMLHQCRCGVPVRCNGLFGSDQSYACGYRSGAEDSGEIGSRRGSVGQITFGESPGFGPRISQVWPTQTGAKPLRSNLQKSQEYPTGLQPPRHSTRRCDTCRSTARRDTARGTSGHLGQQL